jgi:hypothetical protein
MKNIVFLILCFHNLSFFNLILNRIFLSYNTSSFFQYHINVFLVNADPVNYRFNYTGSVQSLTVPDAATSMYVKIVGAAGVSAPCSSCGPGGKGALVESYFVVTPGTAISIYVGGQSGWNGGGLGHNGAANSGQYYGGNGGDSSDLRIGGQSLSNRIIVAGGGGGGSSANINSCTVCSTGGFGGQIGQDGFGSGSIGHGGTQSTGGVCGSSSGCTNGAVGQGGKGYVYDGGGGGGYYGGNCVVFFHLFLLPIVR